jgi:hypothetical protein
MTRAGFVREVRDARDGLRAAWATVPEEWRMLSPGDGRWSPAQILEHVALVQESVIGILERLLEGVPPGGEAPTADALAKATAMDRFGLLNRGYRATAPDFAHPSANPDWEGVLRSLDRGTRTLGSLADRFWNADLTSVIHPHPVLGRMTGYQWFRFVPQHEARHTLQLREALGQFWEARRSLMELPGVGKSIAVDLMLLGYRARDDLRGADPEAMYRRMQALTEGPLDRCVLYVFRCAVHAAETPDPHPDRLLWWNWKD